MSTAVTQAEFARLQGWDRAQVTRLKQAGRLVMIALRRSLAGRAA